MKTKGHWVIKYEDGFYFCGNNLFDKQLRKAQIYHWKEAAEEQAVSLRDRRYSKVANIPWEVIAVVPPQELKNTEATWEFNIDGYAECSSCKTSFETIPTAFAFKVNNRYCRHCGKYMTNSTSEEQK